MNELEWQLLEEHTPLESVSVSGVEIKTGDRVILRPRKNGDIFDMALANQIAIIESINEYLLYSILRTVFKSATSVSC
jgi:predicted HAD superfamily hydrolase